MTALDYIRKLTVDDPQLRQRAEEIMAKGRERLKEPGEIQSKVCDVTPGDAYIIATLTLDYATAMIDAEDIKADVRRVINDLADLQVRMVEASAYKGQVITAIYDPDTNTLVKLSPKETVWSKSTVEA